MRCNNSKIAKMLIPCPECKREVSDAAPTCPHCGRPLQMVTGEPPPASPSMRRPPIFLILSVVALVLTLSTPRFLAFFPLMGVLGFAAVALFRKERGRGWAVLVLVLGIGVWVANQVPSTALETSSTAPAAASRSSNLDAAEIVDFNWLKDPDFGTHGTIKWNVRVRNKSSRNIRDVKVEFTTYDAAGKLVATTFAFVSAIPAGETRAEASYADLYRTERKANAVISEVYFGN